MARLSNLDVMRQADTFPYPDTEADAFKAIHEGLYTLVLGAAQHPPLGYMLASTLKELLAVPEDVRGAVHVDEAARTVRAFEQPTEPERSAAVARVMALWRERDTFPCLRGWRDELWPVYGPGDADLLLSAERSGMGLLGCPRYGVHMTAYVRDPAAPHGLRLWVSRRAANKPTYPGMLDNTAAGGLMTAEDPFECIIREADEEAGLPDALMRARARFTGNVSYIYLTDERAGGGPVGQVYPELQWVYDLELGPGDAPPAPKDGEVAEFYLWDVARIQEELALGKFKHNCALVVLDFFARHGIITPDNEPHYDEILRRMRRKLPFPGPHNTASSQ